VQKVTRLDMRVLQVIETGLVKKLELSKKMKVAKMKMEMVAEMVATRETKFKTFLL